MRRFPNVPLASLEFFKTSRKSDRAALSDAGAALSDARAAAAAALLRNPPCIPPRREGFVGPAAAGAEVARAEVAGGPDARAAAAALLRNPPCIPPRREGFVGPAAAGAEVARAEVAGGPPDAAANSVA